MYLQELLEVAIGLIFVWLVFSVATMQIQEWIATNWLKWRAKDLESTIGNMLSDPKKMKQFYDHPLIQSLSKPRVLTDQQQKRKKELEGKKELNIIEKLQLSRLTTPRPSYIPPANFSSALFDIVIKAGTEESPIQNTLAGLQGQIDALREKDPKAMEEASTKLDEVYKKLAQLASKTDLADDIKAQIKTSINNQLEQIGRISGISDDIVKKINDELKPQIDKYKNELGHMLQSKDLIEKLRLGAITLAIDASKKGELGKSINSLLAGAEDYATNTDKALAIGRKNIEGWFDGTMERLSGWYKRKAQSMALIIGLILAIVLNVDSIALARHLWKEPAVRQALAATADKFIAENPNIEIKDNIPPEQAIAEFQNRFAGLELPIGWDFYMWNAIENSENTFICENLAAKSKSYEYKIIVIEKPANGAFMKKCIVITNLPMEGEWFVKIFGIIITALAAMQGAPFWFDILKKLVNVRSAGANPAEKPKEEDTSNK